MDYTVDSKKRLFELCKRIEADLPTFVNEKRLRHIYGVRDTAVYLARTLRDSGADDFVLEAECASLLHDITKYMNQEELCEKYGIALSDSDKKSPQTLHAITGACFARDVYANYRIPDEILSAVERHTVGGKDMTLLENVVFISDYCEETRVHEECIKTRKKLLSLISEISKKSDGERLQSAVTALEYIKCEILGKTVKYLSEKGDFVHPATVLIFRDTIGKYEGSGKFDELLAEYSRYMSAEE